jgi:hypothetical protein
LLGLFHGHFARTLYRQIGGQDPVCQWLHCSCTKAGACDAACRGSRNRKRSAGRADSAAGNPADACAHAAAQHLEPAAAEIFCGRFVPRHRAQISLVAPLHFSDVKNLTKSAKALGRLGGSPGLR